MGCASSVAVVASQGGTAATKSCEEVFLGKQGVHVVRAARCGTRPVVTIRNCSASSFVTLATCESVTVSDSCGGAAGEQLVLFFGAVQGTVTLTRCANVVLATCARAVHLVDCTNVSAWLLTNERPVLQRCKGIRLGAFAFTYRWLEEQLAAVHVNPWLNFWDVPAVHGAPAEQDCDPAAGGDAITQRAGCRGCMPHYVDDPSIWSRMTVEEERAGGVAMFVKRVSADTMRRSMLAGTTSDGFSHTFVVPLTCGRRVMQVPDKPHSEFTLTLQAGATSQLGAAALPSPPSSDSEELEDVIMDDVVVFTHGVPPATLRCFIARVERFVTGFGPVPMGCIASMRMRDGAHALASACRGRSVGGGASVMGGTVRPRSGTATTRGTLDDDWHHDNGGNDACVRTGRAGSLLASGSGASVERQRAQRDTSEPTSPAPCSPMFRGSSTQVHTLSLPPSPYLAPMPHIGAGAPVVFSLKAPYLNLPHATSDLSVCPASATPHGAPSMLPAPHTILGTLALPPPPSGDMCVGFLHTAGVSAPSSARPSVRITLPDALLLAGSVSRALSAPASSCVHDVADDATCFSIETPRAGETPMTYDDPGAPITAATPAKDAAPKGQLRRVAAVCPSEPCTDALKAANAAPPPPQHCSAPTWRFEPRIPKLMDVCTYRMSMEEVNATFPRVDTAAASERRGSDSADSGSDADPTEPTGASTVRTMCLSEFARMQRFRAAITASTRRSPCALGAAVRSLTSSAVQQEWRSSELTVMHFQGAHAAAAVRMLLDEDVEMSAHLPPSACAYITGSRAKERLHCVLMGLVKALEPMSTPGAPAESTAPVVAAPS